MTTNSKGMGGWDQLVSFPLVLFPVPKVKPKPPVRFGFLRRKKPEPFDRAASELKRFLEQDLAFIRKTIANKDVPLTKWNLARQQSLEHQISSVLQTMNSATGPLVDIWAMIQWDQVSIIAQEMTRSLSITEIERGVDDGFRAIQLEALIQANILGLELRSHKQIISDLMNQRGLSMPRDYQGDIGSYVDMVARTNLAEVNRAAKILKSLERGITLVYIVGHGATDTCGPWEGAIISLVPNDEGIPVYSEIRAMRNTHLFGPNCCHEQLIPVTDRLYTASEQADAIALGKSVLTEFLSMAAG